MKLLLIGPSWVGDMVMAQSLMILLKRQHADVKIDVLAPNWSRPILERMPEVDNILALPFGHGDVKLAERRRFAQSLQDNAYDQAIVLPNSFKSALIPFWANIPVRTGWRGEMRYPILNDLRVLDKKLYPLMVQRFLALGLPKDAPLPDIETYHPRLIVHDAERQSTLERLQLDVSRPVLALCPGAEFGDSKRWPASHYAELVSRMIREGWQVWLFGSENDRAVCGAIEFAVPPAEQPYCIALAGRTSLGEAVDLLSVANRVVSNDSGLMHIAAALNRPLVVPYGSTSPKFTPPLNHKVEIVSQALSCSPCFERVCPLGHTRCMWDITPDRVHDALSQLLPEAHVGHFAANDGAIDQGAP